MDGNNIQDFHLIVQLLCIDHLVFISHCERHVVIQRGKHQCLPLPVLQEFTVQRGGRCEKDLTSTMRCGIRSIHKVRCQLKFH